MPKENLLSDTVDLHWRIWGEPEGESGFAHVQFTLGLILCQCKLKVGANLD